MMDAAGSAVLSTIMGLPSARFLTGVKLRVATSLGTGPLISLPCIRTLVGVAGGAAVIGVVGGPSRSFVAKYPLSPLEEGTPDAPLCAEGVGDGRLCAKSSAAAFRDCGGDRAGWYEDGAADCFVRVGVTVSGSFLLRRLRLDSLRVNDALLEEGVEASDASVEYGEAGMGGSWLTFSVKPWPAEYERAVG